MATSFMETLPWVSHFLSTMSAFMQPMITSRTGFSSPPFFLPVSTLVSFKAICGGIVEEESQGKGYLVKVVKWGCLHTCRSLLQQLAVTNLLDGKLYGGIRKHKTSSLFVISRKCTRGMVSSWNTQESILDNARLYTCIELATTTGKQNPIYAM